MYVFSYWMMLHGILCISSQKQAGINPAPTASAIYLPKNISSQKQAGINPPLRTNLSPKSSGGVYPRPYWVAVKKERRWEGRKKEVKKMRR
jgi:hypothetical protein